MGAGAARAIRSGGAHLRDARGEQRSAELAGDGDDEQRRGQEDELCTVEQEEVGLQARVGEEERQQERHHEVLDTVGDVLGEPGVARHDGAHDADEVRRQVWRNLRALIDTTESADLLPVDLQVALLSAQATR